MSGEPRLAALGYPRPGVNRFAGASGQCQAPEHDAVMSSDPVLCTL